MKVIFKGNQSSEQMIENINNIVRLFRERYGICAFRELNISMTLLDKQGDDVELVDSQTSEVFRVFEVHHSADSLKPVQQASRLKLVVDNTKRELKLL